MILRFCTVFLAVAGSAVSLRCMCSTTAGGVNCYSGWCDVHNWNGKVAACAVVRVGSRQHFACVRVKESSEDTCKVDRRNGKLQVRCWCRKSDYCNIDLADRVEDEDALTKELEEEAQTLPTLPVERIPAQKDEFVIEKTYDVNDEDYPMYSPDSISGIEGADSLSLLSSSAKPEPSLTTLSKELLKIVTHTEPTKTTIPPWRREVPVPLEPIHLRQQVLPFPTHIPRTVPVVSVTVPHISESGQLSMKSMSALPTISSTTSSTNLIRSMQPNPYKSLLNWSDNTRMSFVRNRTSHNRKVFEDRTQWSLSNVHSFISQTPKSSINSSYGSSKFHSTSHTSTEQPLKHEISIGRINSYLGRIDYPLGTNRSRENKEISATLNADLSRTSPSMKHTTRIAVPSTSARTTKSPAPTHLIETTTPKLLTPRPVTRSNRPTTVRSRTTGIVTTTLTLRKLGNAESPKISLQQVPKTKLDLPSDNTNSSFAIKFTSLIILSFWISL